MDFRKRRLRAPDGLIYCLDMDRDDLSDLVREVVGELMEQHFGKLRAELAALREDAKRKRRTMTAVQS